MAQRIQIESAPEADAERRLGALHAASRALAEAADADEAARQFVQIVGERLGWGLAAWWGLDPQSGLLRCAQAWHHPSETASPLLAGGRQTAFRPGDGLVGRAWAGGQPIWVPDIALEAEFLRANIAVPPGARSALLFPVLDGARPVAVVELHKRGTRAPDAGFMDLLRTLGRQAGAVIARAESAAALQRSQAMAGALVEAPLDAVVVTDQQGTIVEFNSAATALFGYAKERALGRKVFDLIVPPATRERNRAGLARHVSTGEAGNVGRRVEGSAMRADGTVFPVEVTTVRLPAAGSPLFVGYVRDLTDRHKLDMAQDLLTEVGQALAESSDPGTVLERAARRAIPTFADFCVVDLATRHRRRLFVVHADPTKERAISEPNRQPPVQNDADRQPEGVRACGASLLPVVTDAALEAVAGTSSCHDLLREMVPQSLLVVPLMSGRQRLGSMCFGVTTTGRRYSEEDLALAEELGRRCSLVLDMARVRHNEQSAKRSAERTAERMARLQAVTAAFSGAATVDEIATVMIQHCCTALQARAALVGVASEDGRSLQVRTCCQKVDEVVTDETGRPRTVSTCVECSTAELDGASASSGDRPMDAPLPITDAARTGELVWLEDVAALKARYPHLAALRQEGGDQAWAALPLQVGGRVVGVLGLAFPEPRSFPNNDVAFLQALASQCAQALDRARLYDREQAARLREAAERARIATLIETSPVGVIVLEAGDETISLMNEEARRLLGNPASQPRTLCDCEDAVEYGKPDGSLYELHDFPWRRALWHGRTVRGEEMRLTLEGDKRVPVLVSATPVRAPDGSIFAAVVIIEDFTERKATEILQASVNALVSHEIRSPLHHIKGFASTLLQRDVQWDEETRLGLLRSIDREADRLTELVNDILDMSRLESGQIQLESAPLAMNDVLGSALRVSRSFLTGHTVTVEAEDGLHALGDAAHLERVVVNLLENAAKYSPPDTRITVRAHAAPGQVVVSVADQGPGIPPADRDRIFERFVRLQDVRRKVPGTGLGLAICKTIVEAHGGHIWVESAPGSGSVFRFAIPSRPAA